MTTTTDAGTCDASMLGVANGFLGPCVLRHQHDGPVHQDAGGARWAATPEPADTSGLRDQLGVARIELAIQTGISADLRAERDTAEAELARLHEGEEPHPDEFAEATPGQWIWRWNRATSEERLDMAARIKDAFARSSACFMGGHEARLEHERADRASLAQLRHALPAVRRALDSLPARCRYHGEDTDPRRPTYGAEACCDTGVPAQRRKLAEQALTTLAALEARS